MNLIVGQLIGAKEAPRPKSSSRSLETLNGAHLSRIEAVSTRKHADAVHLRIGETSSRCDPNFTYHFHQGGLVNIRTTMMYGVGPGQKD